MLEKSLKEQKQSNFDYKEKLRKILNIEESLHCHEIVPQHAEMLMETTQTQKIQIVHYQEKTNEMAAEMENQRTLFRQKMEITEK